MPTKTKTYVVPIVQTILFRAEVTVDAPNKRTAIKKALAGKGDNGGGWDWNTAEETTTDLGTWQEVHHTGQSLCDNCGKVVTKIIGCPDGREICRACFDDGIG